MISVVCSTYRMGGLDVLFHGLRSQTHKDFELVLVDGIKDWRGIDVTYLGEKFDVPTVRTCPEPNPFPTFSFGRCYNAGLDAASGDFLYFVCDFTVLQPDALERAARHFKDNSRVGYMGCQDFYSCPPLHPEFPRYAGRTYAHFGQSPDLGRYVDDLRTGALDRFGWSVFDDYYCGQSLDPCPVQSGLDPKLQMSDGPVGADFFHCANQAVPAGLARFDESLDGAHGQHDIRFARACGIPFTLDRDNVAAIVNPRPHFPELRQDREPNR